MFKRIVTYFDKLEDKVRARLSRWPILYSFIGAVGIILMWKGIWEVAECYAILDGFGSLILGTLILLVSGLLVSFYIGDSVILSGLKRDKKFTEKIIERVWEPDKKNSTPAEVMPDNFAKRLVKLGLKEVPSLF